jgi:uncharacterized protein YecE (DUF72 family)
MELRHLRYFVAVAEEENVSRAALRLHVSQPGISRQIHDLEDEIGFLLFNRGGKSVRLTVVGDDFRLSLKVTEEITVRRWPTMERYGGRAGEMNKHFLNADMFQGSFLAPLIPFRDRIGTIIFEFSHFHPGDWERGRDFMEALDGFFSVIPKGWDYSVEVRNPSLLQPEYFQMLRRHNVAHAYNNWAHMPSAAEQMALPESETADFVAARFLLKPGRTYADAVQKFEPYRDVQEINEEARGAIAGLVKKRKGYIYVNNRLEGCAPRTILAAVKKLLSN